MLLKPWCNFKSNINAILDSISIGNLGLTHQPIIMLSIVSKRLNFLGLFFRFVEDRKRGRKGGQERGQEGAREGKRGGKREKKRAKEREKERAR